MPTPEELRAEIKRRTALPRKRTTLSGLNAQYVSRAAAASPLGRSDWHLLSVRVPAPMAQKLADAAVSSGVTVSEVVRSYLTVCLNAEEAPHDQDPNT